MVGDTTVAYQVVGDGPLDVVFLSDWYNHVEAQWDDPISERFLRRLASLGRLIVFDKRGTGLSDPLLLDELPMAEDWADDLTAVLEAVGSTSAVLICASGGSALGLPFAATAPQRVAALVLIDATACVPRREDYPAGVPERVIEVAKRWLDKVWGTGDTVDVLVPSRAADPVFREWRGQYERLSASPGTMRRMQEVVLQIDVRSVLPSIRTPTLVLHRAGDQWAPSSHGRYLADNIDGATYIELPGADHLWIGADYDDLLAEITEFVTGVRPPMEPDRVLTTIMFTDLVTSTERAAAVGDGEWRTLLDRHDQIVGRQIGRFRGRQIKHTGDGVLVSFDGPARGIRCASAILDALRGIGLEARIGIHTGECELRGDDISGMAVNIAARIASRAGAGEVLVSSTVRDLVAGSSITFEDRGVATLKGVPGEWRLLSVTAS